MEETEIQVTCSECGQEFNPELNRKKGWTCPNCATRHPNLQKQYRLAGGVALGAAVLVLLLTWLGGRGTGGGSVRYILPVFQAVLLVTAALLVFFQPRPWENRALKALLWLVYGSFLFFHLFAPCLLVLVFPTDIPTSFAVFVPAFAVLMLIVGIYLLWLHAATRRALARS